MVQSKCGLFDNEFKVDAAYFKALSHPARLQILKFLSDSNTCISGDISDQLPLARTTVNQHIKELKAAGLIIGHIDGVTTKYCLNIEKIEVLKHSACRFLDSLNTENCKCE